MKFDSKILIFGKNGQLGSRLALLYGSEAVLIGRRECNLENSDEIVDCIREVRPSAIINAAAYTQVDQAEVESESAMKINALAPGVMAAESFRLKIPFVHFSTDYVFDGSGSRPWTESDTPRPLNTYGRSKLEGEKNILAENERSLIFRTSWVYDSRGNNFVLKILDKAKTQSSLTIVDDQWGAPTFAKDLADWTFTILGQSPQAWGIFHLANSGETTWYNFAVEIIHEARSLSMLSSEVTVQPTTSAAFPVKAKRPSNSRLNLTKIQNTFHVEPRSWKVAIRDCLREIADRSATE